MEGREFALDDVKIGAANSTRNYFDHNMSRLQCRPGDIFD
jgi:hypothetical protein